MSMRQAMKRSREEAEKQATQTQSTTTANPSTAPPQKKSKANANTTAKHKLNTTTTYRSGAGGSSQTNSSYPPTTPKKAAAAAAKRANAAAAAAVAGGSGGGTPIKKEPTSTTTTTTTVVTEHTFELISRNDYSLFTEEQKKKLIVAKKRDISKCVCHDHHSMECDNDQCLNRGCKVECIIEMCEVNLADDGRVCQNSRIQQNQRANIEVFDAGDKGRGLRAREDLPAGTFLLEYVGEVVNDRVLDKRLRRYERAGLRHRYIMEIDKAKKLYVDSTKKANISRYMNHCCDPNSFVELWKCGAEWRAAFFTQQKVKKGQELTFDYHWEALGDTSLIPCQCGAKKCHGHVDYMPHPSGWVSAKDKDQSEVVDEFYEMDQETDQETMRKDDFLNNLIAASSRKSSSKTPKSSRSNTPSLPSSTVQHTSPTTTTIVDGFGEAAATTSALTKPFSINTAMTTTLERSEYLVITIPFVVAPNSSSSTSSTSGPSGPSGTPSNLAQKRENSVKGMEELRMYLDMRGQTKFVKKCWRKLETDVGMQKNPKCFCLVLECSSAQAAQSMWRLTRDETLGQNIHITATQPKTEKVERDKLNALINSSEEFTKTFQQSTGSGGGGGGGGGGSGGGSNNRCKKDKDLLPKTNVQFPFFIDWSTSLVHTTSPMKAAHLIEITLKR